jgi:hypothetical protein
MMIAPATKRIKNEYEQNEENSHNSDERQKHYTNGGDQAVLSRAAEGNYE